jgi:hypothetical protein
MADYTFGVGEELQLTSQDGDLIHTWDFGDGTVPSSLPSPSHAYTALGIYSVTHIAKDFCDTCLNIGSHTVQIADSYISVKSLFLDRYSINVGNTVTATIIAQNTGIVYGTGTVTLKFAGQTVDTRDVSLYPGEETSYSVVYQAIRSGIIDVCADNMCTVLFVESMISVISITPNPVISTGEAINATIEVKNNGTFAEEKEIRTTLTNSNNQATIEDTRLINLTAGATQTYTVPIDVRTLPNGPYILCADGKCKAISIAITALTGSLNIVSVPSGAEVWFGNEDKGVTTDTTITDIPSGYITFTLKLTGYNNTTGTIRIVGGMTSYVYTSLVLQEVSTGSISISSIPTNADIYIDGSPQLDGNGYQLKTPATISGINPGPHSVTLKLSGYEDYNSPIDGPINIVAGVTTFLSVAMLRSPITIGNISITSNPAGAEIWIDGNNTGKITPNTIIDASIGVHSFILKLPGYNNTIGDINVVGGATSYIFAILVPLSPTTGAISISSIPQNADIYVNGVLQLDINGQSLKTPATLMNLVPGSYTIKLKKTGYIDFTSIPIDVIAGQTSYLGVTLSTLQVMEAGIPWWFALSLVTGTIYGMMKPKKEEEKNIEKKMLTLSTPFRRK